MDLARKVTVTNSAVSLMLSHAVSQGGAGKDIYTIYTIYNAQTLISAKWGLPAASNMYVPSVKRYSAAHK